jgi:acetoin utilization deacetylase AcuC-like enzyme
MALRVAALATELDAPAGAVLEGGYDLGALADSAIATMEGLGGEPA